MDAVSHGGGFGRFAAGGESGAGEGDGDGDAAGFGEESADVLRAGVAAVADAVGAAAMLSLQWREPTLVRGDQCVGPAGGGAVKGPERGCGSLRHPAVLTARASNGQGAKRGHVRRGRARHSATATGFFSGATSFVTWSQPS